MVRGCEITPQRTGSIGLVIAQFCEGFEDYPDIEQRRVTLDIDEVVIEFSHETARFYRVTAAYLRKSGDSGFHVQALDYPRTVFHVDIEQDFQTLRPRAYDGHVAFENVEQLRQFVHVTYAHPATCRYYSRVVIAGPDCTCTNFSVVLHGTQFEHLERAAEFADTGLTINKRAGA